MLELGFAQVQISDPLWGPRLAANAERAIVHQWQQLEASRCIDNFRLLADSKPGFREGWFFADSDAYKWLDAACRVYATKPTPELKERIDVLVDLLARTQDPDGYLFTYNQVHFPGQRWVNLQIEHELYCHGHLIEAAIAHERAIGDGSMMAVARKAANLLVRDFMSTGPEGTPGHEEVELALIRLYRATGHEPYRDLAERLIERRGRIQGFAGKIHGQYQSMIQRRQVIARQRQEYVSSHPEHKAFRLPPDNAAPKGRFGRLRFLFSGLSGRYNQQHHPIRRQMAPVGHSVRFAYLMAAAALLYREKGDLSLLGPLETCWERMVSRRMYVTGGLGSRPEIEGFGRDFELDPAIAYTETCAALGCLLWNWEMLLATGRARYADLFEWQLHNAAAVGMGSDGCSYLYNNPLVSRGGILRRPWYEVPCCPSNLSRFWAALGGYLASCKGDQIWLHQYVSSRLAFSPRLPVRVEIESGLPWRGAVRVRMEPESPLALTLHLRVPSWASAYRLSVNGQPDTLWTRLDGGIAPTASGYWPGDSFYLPVSRTWEPGDSVKLDVEMPIVVRRADPRVRSCRGRVALTRGPIVYCLEGVDNPGLDLQNEKIEPGSLRDEASDLLGQETWVLRGETESRRPFTAIPYYAWANRGESRMAVWLRSRPQGSRRPLGSAELDI